ncbi:MAG TPA: hypothetical protein VFK50_04630 [Sphingomicrobium sp.]|nr:hypothetical protein [Sphingomicrobium sp.]
MTHVRMVRNALTATALALALAGCGAQDPAPGANAAESNAGTGAAASAKIPDACTFFTKAELEAALGQELRDGEPQSAQDGSICRFRKQLGNKATRTFPNPALSASLGLTSVTIATSPHDPEAVAEIRELDPDAFDAVPGLGDDSYFLGPNLLHVNVGRRGFSVRIDPEARSAEDTAKVREAILGLGRTGASRL